MEWVWVGGIAVAVTAFMVAIELMSRFPADAATDTLEDEAGDNEGAPDDVDGSDEAVTDADE